MSKKPLLEINKTEPVLLEKKLKKLTGERYYFDRRLYEDELGFFNYNQEVTALRKVLDEKQVGRDLYVGRSRNNNVTIEIDATITIRNTEIKDPGSKTLPLETAEALDKPCSQLCTKTTMNLEIKYNLTSISKLLLTFLSIGKKNIWICYRMIYY